jgi:hypothetical protein
VKKLVDIPREAVAFAAGIHAASPRNWDEIAASVSMVGLGDHDPKVLRTAVGSWCLERTEFIERDGREVVVVGSREFEIVRGRGRPS